MAFPVNIAHQKEMIKPDKTMLFGIYFYFTYLHPFDKYFYGLSMLFSFDYNIHLWDVDNNSMESVKEGESASHLRKCLMVDEIPR